MKQKTLGDIVRIFSYTILIGGFAIAFIYLLVYGQRNAEQLEFTRVRNEYLLYQSAVIKTSAGSIVINLDSGSAPISVYSFITLSGDGFYDNSVFNSAILDYYIEGGKQQKGSDKSVGSNVARHLGATYGEVDFDTEPVRGDVFLINTGPNKKEYHFLIVTADNLASLANLKGKYPIVGRVVSGMDVVEQIERSHAKNDGQSVVIEKVKIF